MCSKTTISTLLQLSCLLDNKNRTIQVRYRKGPHMQNSMRKLKLALTLVQTLTDTGGTVLTLMLGYRSLYNLNHMAIAVLCDSGLLPIERVHNFI